MKLLKPNELEKFGFTKTEYGWAKVIPETFRFTYTLYINDDDIYGTLTGTFNSDATMDYDKWLDRMKFRSPEAAVGVEKLVNELKTAEIIEFDIKEKQ